MTGQRKTWLVPLAFIAVSVLGGACDDLLEIDAPSRVPADDLTDPANVGLLVTSAIADFECAFAEYIAAGGLMGNELVDGQLAARMWPYDRRSFDEEGGPYATFTCADSDPGVYQTLSTARFAADNANAALQTLGDGDVSNRAEMLATTAAYSGYAHLLLGEGMCSAAVDGGPELSSQEMFALAEAKFTEALSGGTADITNMAYVGRARARLNQGNTGGAEADAREVPAGFVKNATYSSASFRASNRIWTLNNRDERVSIENDFWDVQHMGEPDPRVTLVDHDRLTASDDLSPYWTQTKYPNQDSPIPIARYEEAQLIIAEVVGGTEAVTIINALHDAADLPDFAGGTEQEILDHVIQEREIELFLESHHFYDKIRLSKPFLPTAGTPYQESGAKGGFYGSTTCLPLPLIEKDNNPNIP